MKVKIKKLDPEAKIPAYAKPGDAGMDLYALEATYSGQTVTYGTGLAIEIPKGYVGLLFPRSSVYKTGQTLTNCVGVIDSGYRGEIMLKYTRGKHVTSPNHSTLNSGYKEYEPGERVGQLMLLPYPEVIFEEVVGVKTISGK